MATISSSGIGSGLDIEGIVTKLMSVEQRPLTMLNQKEISYQAKLSAFGTLKGALSSVQTSVNALKASSLYDKMTAKAGDTGVLAASATSIANSASYSIQVNKLAQAQSLSSQVFAGITSDISTINGKLKIELGTYSGGTFTTNPDKTPVTIDINAAESSLEEIRDKINAANAGVRANLVKVGTSQYKLTMTATDTGAANSMRITAMNSSGGVLTNNTDIAKLSYDPTKTAGLGNEFDVSVAAQDAEIKVDGLTLKRASNTVSDAISGVTLTLAGEGTTTLAVAKDTTAVTSAFQAFVKAYNDIAGQMKNLSAYNAQTKEGSVLTGDSGLRNIQSALRQMVTQAFGGGSAGLRNLSDLGVSAQRDGTLALDSSKLTAALNSSGAEVKAMMSDTAASQQGIAVRMAATVDGMLATGGLLAARTDGINRTIADIGDRREVLARRLEQIEKRYRAQFTALDSLVASMNSTSQYLTRQLASLSSNN